jgi:uncharacterized protein (UPF0548 family)
MSRSRVKPEEDSMFSIRRPARHAIDRFLDRSRELPLSYDTVGLVRTRTAGGDHDETVATIGTGAADFERARAALAGWKQFDIGWVELNPDAPPVEPGTVVAVLIRHLGFWSLNGCRVVYAVGDRHHGTRFGFAYGTLTNHAEAGEELFEVFMNPESGAVMYRILAVSWPRVALTRVGYPITRWLQARFRRDSVAAMKRATAGEGL